MPKTKVEVYDKDQLIYPYIESDHVTFSNGMKVSEMLDQSISMPKVIHEDSSFKVGVGDQDVSSAIVDSSVAEMTIKGKTYQNILPEPSTHVLTNNKEMFKVNEGLDPNVEIVDAVSKSAILSGQTLVNIRGKAVITHADYIDYEVYGLQNNTTYTIVVESTDTNVISVVGFLIDGGNWNCQTSPRTQNCKVVLTTTSAKLMGRVRVRKDNKQDTSQAIQIRVMVLEGDYTNVDIPYFEGMQSVKMPVLKTTGKNLFDSSTEIVTGQGINSTNGLPYNTSSHSCTGFLRVKSNTTYTITQSHNRTWVFAYNKNKEYIKVVKTDILSGGNFTTPNDTYYIRLDVNTVDASEIVNGVQIEEGTVATPYEPHKTNILRTPEEVVLRSLPNGVKDTLNLNTGEYVQRIGEITYTGKDTEGWRESVASYESDDIDSFYTYIHNPQSSVVSKHCHCNLFPVYYNLPSNPTFEYFHILNAGSSQIVIGIKRSKLSSQDSTGIKAWLQANPLIIQYELATPIIKTVDLSSSGNWEKVVLNGSENWGRHGNYGSVTRFNVTIPNMVAAEYYHVFSDTFPRGAIGTNDLECINNHGSVNQFQLQIKTSRLTSDSVDGLKQYLSQNPLTVWYQTATHQGSTQVKQPIFFKDGHIIQSSGTDNSLIPTLDYQAKTSNSYVMDLMKTNTKYTMKAKSASGTFTIDGTSYGAGTNGTFTTPSSMTNKLLVMSNKTNEEVMILEEDVTSKTIPYFKGIKSAFEGKSKIEVLSTGKNLWTATPYNRGNTNYEILNNKDVHIYSNGVGSHLYQYFTYNAKPNTKYIISWESATVIKGHVRIIVRLANNGEVGTDYFTGEMGNSSQKKFTATFTTDSDVGKNGNVVAIGFYCYSSEASGEGDVTYHNIQIIESTQESEYEPYKSNSTKIPLLSPLRSLPNGVCDELIIDRESNKAKIIQRVGELDFSNLQYNTWIVSDSTLSKTVRFTWLSSNMSFYKVKDSSDGICDSIPYIRYNSSDTEHCRFDGSNPSAFMIWVDKSKLTSFDDKGLKKYLSTLPSTRVQYELATPVITEVDLEGFPYIYKDGHIFLNGEIVPVTEIVYSINQCQQISASNEDIIRHEKELTYLQKLIAQYVQVDYESVLLSLKV